MQLNVLQEDLSRALAVCSRFTSTRVQLPVLANILLTASKNKLTLSSTNLEVSISMTISSQVEEEGSLTVPARMITEIISNLKKGQVTITSEKENLIIKNSEFDSQLSGMNAADFPSIPTGLSSNSLSFALNEFQTNFSKVLFAASNDETRPVLTGVLVILGTKETLFVATDGFRLSQMKINKTIDIDEEIRIIIPKNSISEAVRIPTEGNITFAHKKSDNLVLFGFSNATLSSRVIEGEFPDFERIIPKISKIKIDIDKEEFLRSIKLASIFARDSANVVKLNILKSGIEILSESQQHGKQKGKIDAKVEGDVGEKFVIAFNYRFLEEFISSVEADNIKIELTDSNSPVIFLDPKVNNYLHIIMPIRLQE
jgi:DNA polymerase III subunit beta